MYRRHARTAIDRRAHPISWRRSLDTKRSIPFILLLVIALAAGQVFTTQASEQKEWTSAHYKEHPLADTIWNADFKPATMSQLEDAVSKAKFVLLGEIHNNPDHHLLQAQLIRVMVSNGRRPAIVFEMIPERLQEALDAFAETGAKEASDLGDILDWKELGWPDWSMYQPIADAALTAELPLVAGAIDRKTQKAFAEPNLPDKLTQIVNEFGLSKPLKPEVMKALETEISEGHCNMMPATAIPPMIKIQRARDALMAKAMLSPKASDGAVLIAGSGHIRNDWAVPSLIRQKLPDAKIVSVAFLEVDPDRTSPSDYSLAVDGLEQPFDFIYLTPRADLTDQCEEMRKFLEKRKSGQQ